MAMRFTKTTTREVTVESVQFVAFTNTSGLYPDVLVWESTDSGWTPIAWRSSPDDAEEISSEDLELEIATREGGAVMLGSDCTRQQFFSFVFGSDAFAESAFADSDSTELGFDSDVWFPANFEAPDYLMSNNNYLVEYHEDLDWEQAESEVRKDLDALNEHTHEELYGSSYRA